MLKNFCSFIMMLEGEFGLNMTIILISLAGLVICAILCVVVGNLVKAGIAMAATSAVLSVIMFFLKAPLAAAFELSVCAGLIPVIFISAISMTKIRPKDELAELKKERIKRFLPLPILLVVLAAALLAFLWPHIDSSIPEKIVSLGGDVQNILWKKRQVDLLGQIIIILAGVFGVMVFFKESDTE